MKKLIFYFLIFIVYLTQIVKGNLDEDEEKEHDSPEENHEIEFIVLFIILGLFLGFTLLWISNLTSIPYTPMMLLIGLVIGLLQDHLWEIGNAWDFVAGIDAHTLLLVFIPPLIFESAFNVDVFIFLQRIWQILILALIGVAITTVLIAIILRFILQYRDDLNWGESLTIGSILSATDPVAVVALLKELGTPAKFNILLEGESLFNDGTGTVLFFVFLRVVEVGHFSVADFFKKIFRLALGGPAVGLIIALISYPLLKRLMNIGYVFVLMTVWLAYFTFYICESTFLKIHVSGILALVVLGLYLSFKLRGRIVGHLEEKMHTIWRFIAYTLETILFLLTGGYLGNALVDNELRQFIFASDIWKVFVFQILLLLCRGVVNIILWPLLNVVGDNLSWKDILIMTYSGLRGAIGLSLALYVANSNIRDDIDFDRFRVLTVFYVGITIAFTVLLLGITIKYVIQGIGFIKKSMIQERMKLMTKEKLYKKAVRKKGQLQKNPHLDLVKWNKVDEIMEFKKVYRDITQKTITLQQSSLKQNINSLQKIIYCLDQLIEQKRKEKNQFQDLRVNSDEEQKILKDESDDQNYLPNPYSYQNRHDITSSIDSSFSIDQKNKLGIIDKKFEEKQKKKKEDDKSKLSFKVSELSNSEDDQSDSDDDIDNIKKKQKKMSQKSKKKTKKQKKDKIHKRMNNLEYLANTNRAKRVSDVRGEIRMRIYKIVTAQFLERYETHMCLYQSFNKAKYFSKIQEQDLHKKISYRSCYNSYRSNRWVTGLFWKLAHFPIIGNIYKQKFFNGIYQNYDYCISMVEVLQYIKHNKHMVLSLLTQTKQIEREIDTDINFFKEVIDSEFAYDSQSLSWIQTRKALTIIIESLRKELKKYHIRGEVTDKEYQAQLKPLRKIEKKIRQLNLRTKSKDKNRFAGKFKLKFHFLELNDLSDEEVLELEKKMQIEIVPKNTVLFDYKEEISPYVYLVKKGIINIGTYDHPHTKKLGFGEIVGSENVYSKQNKNYARAVVENDAKVYKVPLRFFQDLCNNHKHLEILCKKEESIFRIKNISREDCKQKTRFYRQLTKIKSVTLKDMFTYHDFHQVLQGEQFKCVEALYVYSGQLRCKIGKEKRTVLIGENDAIVTCDKEVHILEDAEYFKINVQPYVNDF